MIDRIKLFFRNNIEVSATSSEASIQLATAALLVEVMAIDHQLNTDEELEIRRLLKTLFDLSNEDVSNLFELAYAECREATSLYQFTRLVNQHFSREEKVQLVLNLWRVAYADGHLDKYEEGMVRRIAELIYVSHRDFIRAKQLARQNSEDN